MCNLSKVKEIRKATGLSIADSNKLASTFSTSKEAIDYFEGKRKIALTYLSDLKKQQNDSHKDWWIRDFFTRDLSELRKHNDPLIQKWADERTKYESFFRSLTSKNMNTYDDVLEMSNISSSNSNVKKQLYIMAWYHSLKTHMVPHFEPNLLAKLINDPIAKLRPLKEMEAARVVLRRNSLFDPSHNEDKKAEFLSCCIKQADEYLQAAKTVDLMTKPLLLYYASTSLAKAILVLREDNFIGQHNSHGLNPVETTCKLSLRTYTVRQTKNGLFSALQSKLPGASINNGTDQWSLLLLCQYIPELQWLFSEYLSERSFCCQIVNYSEHQQNGVELSGNYHITPILTAEFLRQIGVDANNFLKNKENQKLIDEIYKAFPSIRWELGRIGDCKDLQYCTSHSLQDTIIAPIQQAPDAESQKRIFPLLFDGAVDGSWNLIYNFGSAPPNQFAILCAVLYGLSMIVRYNATHWNRIITSEDTDKALIEELLRISEAKLPILATELIFRIKILGAKQGFQH